MNILIPNAKSIKYLSGELLMVAEGSRVKIHSRGVEQTLDCTVFEPGDCAFDSKVFDGCGPATIQIDSSGDEVEILFNGSGERRVPKKAKRPFLYPTVPGAPTFAVTKEQLTDAYEKIFDFIYTEIMERPDIAGLNVVATGDEFLTFRGASSIAIVERRVELSYPIGVSFNIIQTIRLIP